MNQSLANVAWDPDSPVPATDADIRDMRANGVDNSSRSSIFVIRYEDFIVMSAHKLQEIFRRRHILVSDTPSTVDEFSAENLAALGGFERLRNI